MLLANMQAAGAVCLTPSGPVDFLDGLPCKPSLECYMQILTMARSVSEDELPVSLQVCAHKLLAAANWEHSSVLCY